VHGAAEILGAAVDVHEHRLGLPAPPGYFQAVRAICDRHDVLFISDEVMTGFGRTGRAFGVDHWDVVPDLMACAKGLGAGYAPLAAVVATDRVMAPILNARQNLVGGHTYAAHTLSCAVGVEVLRILHEEQLIANAARVGAYLLERLRGLLAHPLVGDVRGLGLMAGIEFVRDKATKEPFPPELGLAQQIMEEGLTRGLICYPLTGTVNGVAGDHIKFSPPLILTETQADELVATFTGALDAVAARLGLLVAG
jgi:adenosylmethionine-8-amino-7-oxononanoate aminotransferase